VQIPEAGGVRRKTSRDEEERCVQCAIKLITRADTVPRTVSERSPHALKGSKMPTTLEHSIIDCPSSRFSFRLAARSTGFNCSHRPPHRYTHYSIFWMTPSLLLPPFRSLLPRGREGDRRDTFYGGSCPRPRCLHSPVPSRRVWTPKSTTSGEGEGRGLSLQGRPHIPTSEARTVLINKGPVRRAV
jgi:hypothetical protein